MMKRLALFCGICLASGFQSKADTNIEPASLFARHFQTIGADASLLTNSWCAEVAGFTDDNQERREFTLVLKSPGLGRFTTTDARGRKVQRGRSGDGRFWEQDSTGTHDLGTAAAELSGLMLALNPPGLAAIGERLEDALCEPDTAEHRPVHAVGRKKRRGVFPRLLFDDQNGMLVRIGHTRLDDYRDVGGIHLPHRIRQGAGMVYSITSIRRVGEVATSTFDRPGPKGGWLSQLRRGDEPRPRPTTWLSKTGQLEIVRRPKPALAGTYRPSTVPSFDPASGRHGQVNLQGADLSGSDLTGRTQDLLHADFDSRTRWPDSLPAGFDPHGVLRLGVNPGLGIRKLHARGITGKGVGVAVIDFPLLTEHVEYADRLRVYEEVLCPSGMNAHMHGTAVASILAGKTCGVAPGAELYFVASQNASFTNGAMVTDFRPIASAIDRLLDINKLLPPERKIRVISVSMGWSPTEVGYAEVTAAVERASAQNVFVISTALRRTHRLQFDGLSRPAQADPDSPESYGPGSWWAQRFWCGEMRFKPGKRLCVPMDGRTTASPKGAADYVHYDSAGWSWAVPWVAGLYALACQVEPDITPERFWRCALQTGDTVKIDHEGEVIPFGTIADPAAFIRAVALK